MMIKWNLTVMMNVEVELSTSHKLYQCNFGHYNNITRDKKCEMKFYKSENIIWKNSNKLIIHYTKLEAFTDTKGVLLTETTKCKKDQKG